MEIGRDRAWDPSFVGLAIADTARTTGSEREVYSSRKLGSAPRPLSGVSGEPIPWRGRFVADVEASRRTPRVVFCGSRRLIGEFQEKLPQGFALARIGCTLLLSRVARLLLTSPFPSLRPRLRSGVFRFGALATCFATCSLWRGSRRFGALATCFATCSLWFEPRRVFCFRSLWREWRENPERSRLASLSLALAEIAPTLEFPESCSLGSATYPSNLPAETFVRRQRLNRIRHQDFRSRPRLW